MNDIELRHLALVAASLHKPVWADEMDSEDEIADRAVAKALKILAAVGRFHASLPVAEPPVEETARRQRVTEILNKLETTRSFNECTELAHELRSILLG